MEIIKCCKNCKWLEHMPKKNRYGDVEHFCLLSGMTIFSKDTEKDLTKYQATTKWARDNCRFELDISKHRSMAKTAE